MEEFDITDDTPIEEVIEKYPFAVDVFQKYGISVIVCGQPVWDTIGKICERNGIQPSVIINEIKRQKQQRLSR